MRGAVRAGVWIVWIAGAAALGGCAQDIGVAGSPHDGGKTDARASDAGLADSGLKDSGPSGADGGPPDAVADGGPSFADSGSPNADSGPPNADSGPSGTDIGPSGTDGGPSLADSGSQNADSGPSGTDSGPSGTDTGPSGTDSGPSGADSGPSGTDSGPPVADAGATDSGILPPLTWGTMTIPATGGVGGVWGRSLTEIYLGAQTNFLFVFDGQRWTQVSWYTGDNNPVVGLWGTATKIFVETTGNLFVRDTSAGTTTMFAAPQNNYFRGLSGVSDTEVYLVGWMQGCSGVFLYDGTALNPQTNCTSLDFASYAVTAPASGVAYVGGQGTHQMAQDTASSFTDETLVLPGTWTTNTQNQFQILGAGFTAGHIFAVGSHHAVFERTAPGMWTLSYSPSFDQNNLGAEPDLMAVSGLGGEAYAVGATRPGQGAILRYFQGAWTGGHYTADVILSTVWAATPNTYYAGGAESGLNGILLVGRR